MSIVTKKIKLFFLSTAIIGATIIFHSPVAEANILGNIIGAGIGMALASSQVNQQVDYYNNTEQGRYELYNEFQAKYGVVTDAYKNERLDGIMATLSHAIRQVDSSIDDKPYLYFLNKQKSFNAFCSLGHVMSVNEGLLDMLENDAEVAVVLGHEMTHGQKNHTVAGVRRALKHETITAMAVEATGGGFLAGIIGTAALNQANATYTKEDEWEADNGAFEYMIHSDYNPGATAAVWQRVIDKHGDDSQSEIAAFFNPSDHPGNMARRDNYEKKLYEYSGKHVHANDGVVKVNGKDFMTVAPAAGMSSAERAYFVQGNLANAYHHGYAKSDAYVDNGTVKLGEQAIVTPTENDENPQVLADRLNEIK